MELVFKPSTKQYEAWEYLTDHETSEIGYGGGAFGGKSYLGAFWILAMCLAYPDTGWLMGRKELSNLKRTTLLTFYKVCQDYGIEPINFFTHNQQTNIITFPNKSQIFLLDLSYQPSDPLYTRLGGLELTGAFIDESNEIEGSAVDIIKTRIGRRRNDIYKLSPKLLETFNPDKGHVHRRYYKPWRDNELPVFRKFIRALPTDNPYATQEYLDQLRRSDPITVQRLLLGNFDYEDDPSALLQYDAIVDLFTNTVVISEDSQKFITADIARFGQDTTTIYLWKDLEAYKIIETRKRAITETAEDIKMLARDERVPYSHILIDEDGVGGGVVDILRGARGFVANSTPIENDRTGKPDNFMNLKAQCSYALADLVNSRKMAIRTYDMALRDKITEELEQIKSKDLDKDGKRRIVPKDEIKEIIGRSPDHADAIMMRAWFELNKSAKKHGTKQFRPNYAKSGYASRGPRVQGSPRISFHNPER